MSDEPSLSRRDLLAGAAIAGAGLLVEPGAAAADVRSGGAGGRGAPSGRGAGRVFSLSLGSVAGASRAIDVGRTFALAGVQWSGPATASIELRARGTDGRWSRWAVASTRGHDPDRRTAPDPSAPSFGEPLWFGPADVLQLRTSAPVADVRLHMVAAAGLDAVIASRRHATGVVPYPLATPVLDTGPGQPPIIARRAWAGRGNGPSAGPYYGQIKLAFVHHTDNPNGYTSDQVPAMILAIYDYHRYTRGFFDIAYNFIIDSFGRIWEARAGGIDQPVIGAQAGGYNAQSTGIAMLGTFMYALPAPPAMDALERLLSWKLSLHGIPTVGHASVEVDPADAFYTPFRPGQIVSLPRIAGHRDGDLTDCPGNDLYGRLESVRPRAHELAGSPSLLTLAAVPATVGPATPVALNGRLTTLAGAPIAGAQLQVQTISTAGVTAPLATVATEADGSWTTGFTPALSQVIRAVYAGPPAAVSNVLVVGLAPAITLTLAAGPSLRLTGTVKPAKPIVTITVYRARDRHRRKPVVQVRARVRHGVFSVRLPLAGRPGDYVVLASTTGDVKTAASRSPALTVKV